MSELLHSRQQRTEDRDTHSDFQVDLLQIVDQSVAIATLNLDGTVASANRRLCDALGVRQKEFVGQAYAGSLWGDQSQIIFTNAFKMASTNIPWKGELCFFGANESLAWLEVTLSPVANAEGRVGAIAVIGFDITERKMIEQALSASRAFSASLIEAAPAGVFLSNKAGHCVYTNEVWSKVSGVSLESAWGSGWLHAVHADDRDRVSGDWYAFVAGGLKSFNCEYRYTHLDGKECSVKSTGVRLSAELQRAQFLRLEEDLTERKHKEAALAQEQMKATQASKFSALGEMAGGIAHEINNPLTIILARGSQLRRMIEEREIDYPIAMKAAESIEKTVMKIARIVKSMRTLSRFSGEDPFEFTPVQYLVADTIELCADRFRSMQMRLEIDEISERVLIQCRPTEICQLLLNLLNNALDSVTAGPEGWVRVSVKVSETYVDIAVTNGGIQIDPAIQAKLFQPFFTTKAPGKGTGLGLSISKKIMIEHRGELWFDAESSSPRFVARFPVRAFPQSIAA